MHKKKQANDSKGFPSTWNQDMDIRNIIKDIELLGSSHMTWKERKDLENRKVVSFGGRPSKKQRLPLSVAREMMKKQKERKQKMLDRLISSFFLLIVHLTVSTLYHTCTNYYSFQNLFLGRFGGKLGVGGRRSVQKRKPEDMVLKSSEGNFRNGVPDVKHLLRPAPSRDSHTATPMFNKEKKNGSGKKNRGKKKSGGRKRH